MGAGFGSLGEVWTENMKRAQNKRDPVHTPTYIHTQAGPENSRETDGPETSRIISGNTSVGIQSTKQHFAVGGSATPPPGKGGGGQGGVLS